MRSIRWGGFTLLEVVVSISILAVLTYVAWEAYIGGTKQSQMTSEHLSAMQNALVLMEAIQEDLRQITVLNQYRTADLSKPISFLDYTIRFSKNSKSFMLRKSTLTDTSGSEMGSSFSVVTYQLCQHPTVPDAFIVQRIERAADGKKVLDTGRETDETVFRSLLVRDVRYDMVVRMENMTYRTFVRVSLTGINQTAGASEPKLFFVSNIFDIPSPEIIHNTNLPPPNPPGFARRFVISQKFQLAANSGILPGPGCEKKLSELFSEPRYVNLGDYLDKSGTPKDFDLPAPPATAIKPFDYASFTSAPTLRRNMVATAVQNLSFLLSPIYKGRILGQITGTTRQGQPPPWPPIPFSFDTTPKATSTLAVQINDLLGRAIPRGTEAVQEVAHTLGGAAKAPSCPVDARETFVTTCTAQKIIEGQ